MVASGANRISLLPLQSNRHLKVEAVALFPFPTSAPLDAGYISLRGMTEHWLDELWDMAADSDSNGQFVARNAPNWAQLQERLRNARSQTESCSWAILDNESGEFAGEVTLDNFDSERNSINLSIRLAGTRWFDRGIGTVTLERVLTYAFDQLCLAKVAVVVPVSNARAHRVFEKLGFQLGRQFTESGDRFQRMALTKLDFIQALAERLMGESLDTQRWSFAFDSGKRRAGLCDHTNRRISLSRHMAAIHPVDQSRQVMYHEIAHALAGVKHGHDAQWLRIATDLGYRNERISAKEVDEEHARWQGQCPNGHSYYRYRKPTRQSSCSKCSKTFDTRYLIGWTERV